MRTKIVQFKRFSIPRWAILALALSALSFSASADPCRITRAAFDLGSSKFKLRVAEVEVCGGSARIIREIPVQPDQLKVTWENTGSSSEDLWTPLEALEELVSVARDAGAQFFSAVATAAARDPNSASHIAYIRRAVSFPVSVLSQEDEGGLEFFHAVHSARIDPDHAVVWGIGGGSMQFSFMDENGQLQIVSGGIASESFRDYIIEGIQHRDPTETRTPNPISEADKGRALHYAAARVRTVAGALRAKLAEGSTRVLGIGGVHYYSIRGQLDSLRDTPYTRVQLRQAVLDRVGKSDAELGGGPFASTEASNLILVYVFMRALGIEEVLPVKVNLADGLLLAGDEYWPSRRVLPASAGATPFSTPAEE